MILYIRGQITDTFDGRVIIENNGIGYEVYVPENSPVFLAKEDETVTLYASMVVREDDISLYGFLDKESLKMFCLLTTVSGIGNKGAMSILSKLSISDIKRAIIFDDPDSLARANGVGKKTAAKLILELKDKIDGDFGDAASVVVNKIKIPAKEQAVMALQSLGFTKSEAASFLYGINDDSLSVEEYVRLALKSKR